MNMTVSLLWFCTWLFFFFVGQYSFVHNVGVVYVSFTEYDPFCVLMIFAFPSNHFVAFPFSRPITYSLLFFCFDSHHQVSINAEHHSYNVPVRHDEKIFSWLVMHSFPSVIVGFVFWALTLADSSAYIQHGNGNFTSFFKMLSNIDAMITILVILILSAVRHAF